MRKVLIYVLPRIVFVCLLPTLLVGSNAAVISVVILDAVLIPLFVCILSRKLPDVSIKSAKKYVLISAICLLSTAADVFTLYMGVGYAIYFVLARYLILREEPSLKNYARYIITYSTAQLILLLVDVIDGQLTAWYWNLQPYCTAIVILFTSVVDFTKYIIKKRKSNKS